MRLSRFLLSASLVVTAIAGLAGSAGFAAESARLDSNDAATADGSLRCGLSNGEIYAVLTTTDHNVVLSPDSWSSDDEPAAWNSWLVQFDDALFSKWMHAQSGEGQQTVRIRVAGGKVETAFGRFYAAGGADEAKFDAAVSGALQKTLAQAPAMPVTKNPLKELQYIATFMSDSKVVPRYGRDQLGFMAILAPDGKNIVVYGRTKEGRAPGIQIISEQGSGSIVVTDEQQFLQKARELE